MVVVVIIFVFYILHIQFLLSYLIWGHTEHSFFGWVLTYNYSYETAFNSLIYTLLCLSFFLIGYYWGGKTEIEEKRKEKIIAGHSFFYITDILLLFQILCFAYVIIAAHFSYARIVEIRESVNFVFEFRIFFLILFSYILFNSEPVDWKKGKYRMLLILLIIYGLSLFVIQARSLIFEFFGVCAIYWVKVKKIRIKVKYIVCLYLVSIFPNIIVLFRLSDTQVDFSNSETYKNIFTYEYSLLFNNILSEVMSSNTPLLYGSTLSNAFFMLIPSFLRNTQIDKEYITMVAHDAGVFGGGFSLLAELYMNFGYLSIVFFLIMGLGLGRMFKCLYFKKNVSLYVASTPLMYVWFLLAFRNDLAVFLKQIIQLFFIILIFALLKTSTKKSIYGNRI